MEFFEAVERRRSVRIYKTDPVPDVVVDKALDAALIAPNSSNMQTWRFHWVKDAAKKEKLAQACLGQGAATTAQHLIVASVDASQWKISQKAMLEYLGPNAKFGALQYYKKLVPLMYGFRILAPLKWLIFNVMGIFKPTARHPWSSRDIDEMSIKSSALACENFMLAIAAQGYDTCPMEGFDEWRVKRLLKLSLRSRVVMVISVGLRDPGGIWGKQFRIPREIVVHKV